MAICVAVGLLVAGLATACQMARTSPPPPAMGPFAQHSPGLLGYAGGLSHDRTVRFDHVTLEDGLSQSTVTAVVQDGQGFIWLGTDDGLNRYDGYRVKVFKHDLALPASLSDNQITTLYVDRGGTLWIGTDGGGLDRFDANSEQFVHYRHNADDASSLSSDSVTAILEDTQGGFWVGTSDGLNKLDRTSDRFTAHRNQIDPPEVVHGSNYVTALHQDRMGQLWVGTLGGLLVFDTSRNIFQLHPLLAEDQHRGRILTIFEDAAGKLWVGTEGDGLFGPQEPYENFVQYLHEVGRADSLSHDVVRAIQQDHQGVLWIGTDHGLDRLDPESEQFVHYHHDPGRPQSLSDNTVTSLFVDEAGILWVGTNIGGVNRYDPFKDKFGRLTADPDDRNSLSQSQVWSLLEDGQGSLWIGTSDGLNRLNRNTGRMTVYRNDPQDPQSLTGSAVTALYLDRSGGLWVGTDGGLNRYDPDVDGFVHLTAGADGAAGPPVSAILEDKQARLWVGTAGSGLLRMEPDGRLLPFVYGQEDQASDSQGQNTILSLYEDRQGNLWVGTQGGLAIFDPGDESFTFYRHQPDDRTSLSDDEVFAIHQDRSGALWLATGDGLDRLDPVNGTFTYLREEDGLPSGKVVGILEDDNGRLWLSTKRGLASYSPDSESVRVYDTNDGLQSLEFNEGAYFRSRSGEMFFGGINGFNFFYPEEVKDNPYVPPVVAVDFQILNRSVPVGPDSALQKPIMQTDRIDLARQDTVFSFELAALHYAVPEENQYAYIMEGFDDNWNFIGNRRFATYTNLPPGRYTFRAIGSNSDGVWNEVGTAIEITMPYPFWQTWWFLGLVILAAGSVFAGGYVLRIRSIAGRTHELEELVAVRTAEIEQRRQIAEGLREILLMLNSQRSLGESLNYIASQSARLTDAEDTVVFRCDEDDPLRIVATNPGGQIKDELGPQLEGLLEPWVGQEIWQRQPLVIPDLASRVISSGLGQPGLGQVTTSHRALLGIPLFVGDDLYGGLLMLYRQESTFSEEDLELGFTFADQAALAIANERLREQAEQTAVASERNRLARDLHDAVTQTLFSASLIAEALPVIWASSPEEGQQLLDELRLLTRGALAEMRTLLLELRPAALEEASLSDLLQQLAEAVTGRTGIPVRVVIDSPCSLPTGVRIALFRITQESLNNVVKHARATAVELGLRGCNDGQGVILSIEDNGRGFDPIHVSGDHFGLDIIRERSQAIGATLTIESQADRGTRITVVYVQPAGDGTTQSDSQRPGNSRGQITERTKTNGSS